MPPTLEYLVARIRRTHFAFDPAQRYELDSAHRRGVPASLLDFYRLCDGAFICDGDDFADPIGRRYRLKIPRLTDLKTTQSYGYIAKDSPLYQASVNWWQIVDYGDANWLAFDASTDSSSGIIDIFHETVGKLYSHAIVANSMADLLDRLLQRGGVYWFDDDFKLRGRI